MSFAPIKSVTSRTVVLEQENIDTDQIIPARFLTTTSQSGLGQSAFYDWRFEEDGTPKGVDLFNSDQRADYRILVAGQNFGCGSSREHAPWALKGFGFDAVISSDIADIFTSNSLKNQFLPVVIDAPSHAYLLDNPGIELTIDLENQIVTTPNGGFQASFKVEPFARQCLLQGVDTLGHLMNQMDDIKAFEAQRGDAA
ncbi:MAG: 3-isopropylmalate dehydratase small subunit [Pseudomonadota bacterium]